MRASDLDQFIAVGTPRESKLAKYRTLYAPVDKVHDALLALVNAAETSVQIAMFAFDDSSLLGALAAKLASPDFTSLQITLDLGEATLNGAEIKMLHSDACPLPSTITLVTPVPGDDRLSLAVGTSSSGHKVIMHLKHLVLDGVVTVHGSTNWSHQGQFSEDNEITVIFDPLHAARCEAHLNAVHMAIAAQGHVLS